MGFWTPSFVIGRPRVYITIMHHWPCRGERSDTSVRHPRFIRILLSCFILSADIFLFPSGPELFEGCGTQSGRWAPGRAPNTYFLCYFHGPVSLRSGAPTLSENIAPPRVYTLEMVRALCVCAPFPYIQPLVYTPTGWSV